MKPEAAQKQFPCKKCGAAVEFHPASSSLQCPYCGFQTPVPRSEEEIRELDFEAHLNQLASREEMREVLTVRCGPCGAETSLPAGVTAAACPFCGSSVVAGESPRASIRPKALLPFRVSREEALRSFRAWISGLWFAPGELKRLSRSDDRLTGLYVPYWTYDADTTSFYRGERGDDYWVAEHYTATENGRQVTRTRQVRRTRWTAVSGTVWNDFDDLLVLAAPTLPRKHADRLEPWDLAKLEPYRDEYLSGFIAGSYQVGLKEGFAIARETMEVRIRDTAARDIGGDHQRIDSLKVQYDRITFKHILLPVWMSAYRYRDRPYRFLVNGRTGEVQGERPLSFWKIAFAVLLVLLAAAAAASAIALSGS